MISFIIFAVVGVLSQSGNFPRFFTIGDIEADDLFKPPQDPVDPKSPFRGPLDPPYQKPQSYRTIYLPWWRHPNLPAAANEPITAVAPKIPSLTVRFLTAQETPNLPYTFRLDPPNLEIDPFNCANGGTEGNCRCNTVRPDYETTPPTYTANTANTREISVNLPNWNYFEHSPYPGQNPYMRTYRKLCIQEPQRQDIPAFTRYAPFIDTTIWIAVSRACTSDTSQTFSCGNNPGLQFLSRSHLGNVFPDAGISLDWLCNKQGWLGAFFPMTLPVVANVVPVAMSPVGENKYIDQEYCWGETLEMFTARTLRTQCCGSRDANQGDPIDGSRFWGTCFNPNVEKCCGWKPYNPYEEQCCSRLSARINYLEQPCKCQFGGGNTDNREEIRDCQNYGPTVAAGTNTRDSGPITNTRSCCVSTKYSGTGQLFDNVISLRQYGVCYDRNDKNVKCCTDGNIYDPGAEQCCPVNGVQSLNQPCPCNTRLDCPEHNSLCCLQRFARSWPENEGLAAGLRYGITQCNAYANYPEGTGAAEVQRCYGSCYSAEFQICCNGVTCSREYDRCCNSTCCNRFTSTCMEGSRPGTWGAGGRFNPNDYLVSFEVCSEKECFTTKRTFWVFVMPVFWLFASLTALAFVIVVARRATDHVFEMTEQALVFFSVLLIFVAMTHYFSPSYKYGIVAVLAGIICILAAVMRSVRLSLAAIIAVIIFLNYWVDPFSGNIYLSMATKIPNPTPRGNGVAIPGTLPGAPYIAGLLEYLLTLDRLPRECTQFYDFFEHDKYVHDFERRYNPTKMTYAYCSKAWITALFIFSLLGILFGLMMLLLTIFSFSKKLIPKAPKDDLVFEVRPEYE